MKLRITFKTAATTLVILLCTGIAFSLYFRMSATERAGDFDLYTLVPPDSRFIVDTDNMTGLMLRINDLNCSKDSHFLYFSSFFCHLKDHINALLEHTPHGLSKQMNKMLISLHEPNGDRDQVFYCRLGAGDYEFIEQFIRKYFVSSFPSRFFDYRGEEIRIYPMSDDTFLACYVTTEFLVVSYQKKLIEQVIDARLSKMSILSDNHFSGIRAERRMITPATIYACMQPVEMGKDSDALRYQSDLGHWTEFNVNLSNDAIYLSGISYDADSCATFVNTLRTLKPVGNFPGSMLPASAFFFSKVSISDLDKIFGFTSRHTYTKATYSNTIMVADEAVQEFLREYAGDDVTTCMFHQKDTAAGTPHAVMNIPLRNRPGIGQALAELCHSGHPYNSDIYALPRNTLFAQLTGITDASLSTYACVYENRLLISPHAEDLQAYIELIEGEEPVLEDTPYYGDMTSALSQNYKFMMMADMEEALRQPESYVRLIPNLFFRYSRFFRRFMLTVQFTCVDDVVYPNVILTYKGCEKH